MDARQPLTLSLLVFRLAAVAAPLALPLVKSVTVGDVLIVAVLGLLVVERRRLPLPPAWVMLAGYLFLLAALASTFRATRPLESLTQIAQYAFVLVVLIPVTLACVRTLREAAITLLLLCSGSIVGTLVALVTHATQGAGRMLVFYSDNPNRLGYPSAYMIPLVLLAVVWLWRDGRRVLACVVTVVLGYLLLWPLMASGSRSATMGTLAALGVFVLAKPPVSLRQLVTRGVALGLLLAALVQTLLASSLFPPTLQERLLASTDPARRDTLVGDRERLAEAGTKAFLDSPFLGVGLDNFRYVALQYEPSATPQQPHNLWLQLLAQVGLLGAIGFFVLVAVWVVRLALLAHAPGDQRDSELVWACVSSMVGVLTVMMAIPIMIDRHYWLIYGVGLAMIGIVDRHRRGLVGS